MENKESGLMQAMQQDTYEIKGKLNLLGNEAYRQHREIVWLLIFILIALIYIAFKK